MGVFGGFITPAQPVTGVFLSKGPCPVYYSRHGRHYIDNECTKVHNPRRTCMCESLKPLKAHAVDYVNRKYTVYGRL